MRAQFTVFFEGPFWVGILESEDECGLVAARHVFGAEPTNAELVRFMLYSYHLMSRTAPISPPTPLADRPVSNPKRAIREARKAMSSGPSSRSREALSAELEATKSDSRAGRRERSRAEEELRFAQRAEKRRERHRGH